jgi:septum formation protein
MDKFELILASTSKYRAQMLGKLNLPFTQLSANTPETELPGETATDKAIRLSIEKARGVLGLPEFDTLKSPHKTRLIIGSDQVAHINGRTLHKPGNFETAFSQLKMCCGDTAIFDTGIAVINAETGREMAISTATKVTFLRLSDQQITAYLNAEQPYDCAGSFKSEGLGITLFEKIETEDPNGLVGLPLIKLTSILREFGYEPLK